MTIRRNKLIPLMLVVFALMILCIGSTKVVTADTNTEDAIFTYEVNEDDTVTITDFSEYPLENVVVPETLNGKNVVAIGKGAFSGYCDITKVTLPESLKTIEEYAFAYCDGIEEIIIPDGVEVIGENSFCGCSNLMKVILPKGITRINEYTFERCENLRQIRIPNKVKTIGQGAFEDSGLIRIELPKSIKSIADDAFGYNADRIFYVEKGSYAEKYAKKEYETYILGEMPQIEKFKKIKSCKIADIPEQIFEKNGLNVPLVVKDGNTVLKENVDYLIGESYSAEKGGKNDYVIEIKGAGAYTGTIEKTFKAREPQIKDAEKLTKGQWARVFDDLVYAFILQDDFTKEEGVSSGTIFWYLQGNSLLERFEKNYKYTIPFNKLMDVVDEYFVSYDRNSMRQMMKEMKSWSIIEKYSYNKKTDSYSFKVSGYGGFADATLTKVEKTKQGYKLKGNYVSLEGKRNIQFYIKKTSKGFRVLVSDKCKHKSVTDKAVAATTTKNGLTSGKHCDYCGKILAKQKKIAKVSSARLSYKSTIYDGKIKTPKVTVKDAKGKKLKKGTNYTVKYSSDRKNIGTYKVTITYKGNYRGSTVKNFKIVPAKVNLKSVTAGKEQFTVKCSSIKGNCLYQIRYKEYKASEWETVTTKSVTKSITDLKSKKSYQVKVRAYKTVDEKIYYGSWSKTETVTTK